MSVTPTFDITERKKQQEELIRASLLIESSDDAIISRNLEGKIMSWNPGAARMYGYTQEEIMGKSVEELYPQDRRDEFQKIMDRIKKGERIEHFETKRLTKSGNVIDVSVTISPIKNVQGSIIGASAITRDITQRKKQEEELHRLAAIVESSNDAIIGKTLDGVITTWNKGAEKLYGYKEDEMVGKTNKLLIPEDHITEWKEFSDKLARGETIENFETIRLHKDGRKIDVSITFSPVKDAEGRIVGSSAIVRDITEWKKVDTMKDEFVALASHQLKTPLTSIRWYAELLLKSVSPHFTEKQVRYIHEIDYANKRMIHLVDALLNVSRIDLGTFIVDPVESNLTEIIDGVIDEFSVQLAKRNMQVERHYEVNLPRIRFDTNVMHIILSNLISNAIGYSKDSGKVSITVRKDAEQVHISITDTGIGIPEAQKDKIFTKFARADNAMVQNTDGSGLGLYIVKSVVAQSGGAIAFTSEENKGTTFTASYPLSGMKMKEGTKKLG